MRPYRTALALALALAGCKKQRTISLDVTTGHETDAFAKAPPVSQVEVDLLDAAGNNVVGAQSTPGGSFALGDLDKTQFVQVDVTGTDAAGTVRTRGRSMGTTLEDFAGDVLPVFVQRLGEWARPPNQLSTTHVGGVAFTLQERFLVLTGGAGSAPAEETVYDLLSLAGAPYGTITRQDAATLLVARSIVPAPSGNAVLAVGPSQPGGNDTAAAWVDFDNEAITDKVLPKGLDSWDELAGGTFVTNGKTGTDAVSYLVGPTRVGAPTDKVLIVASDGTLTVAKLTEKRQGAAAAWIGPVGLVVAGGGGPQSAHGVETLAPNGTAFLAAPYPPDAVVGAGAVWTTTGDEMLLVGGDDHGKPAATRIVSASCLSTCAAKAIDGAALGRPIAGTTAFYYAGTVLAIGSDTNPDGKAATGQMRAFRLAVADRTVTEVPLKEPRIGAAVVATPFGTVALLGGQHLDKSDALTVELFFPQ